MKNRTWLFGLAILALASCGREADRAETGDAHVTDSRAAAHEPSAYEDHDHDEDVEAGEHKHDHLKVPLDKQKSWGIETGPAAEIELVSANVLNGAIGLNENRTAHVSSFTSGKVDSLRADLGRDVGRGEVLAVINSPEYAQAQTSFVQAFARSNLMKREYERARALLEENAIEQKEYLRREAEYESAVIEYGVRESNLKSFGMPPDQIAGILQACRVSEKEALCQLPNPSLAIRAPLKGRVIFRDVVPGEHVGPEKTLFTVSDLSGLWAIVDAYENDLPFIDAKSRVKILSSLYPDREFPGRVDNIGSTVDPKLRTVKIRVEVDNREGLLKPNMFIQAAFESPAGARKGLAVPEDAIQTLDRTRVVFLIEGEDVFAPQPIRIGEKFGEMRAVLGGLRAGQRIVLKGAFNLKAELNRGAAGHGHLH